MIFTNLILILTLGDALFPYTVSCHSVDSVYDSGSHHGLAFYSGVRRTRIEMSTEMSALKIALLFIYFLFVDVFLVVFLMFFCFVCCCCYFFFLFLPI